MDNKNRIEEARIIKKKIAERIKELEPLVDNNEENAIKEWAGLVGKQIQLEGAIILENIQAINSLLYDIKMSYGIE